MRDLNGLAYLANATVPCYQIEPLDATVRKSDDGPLYPQLIWDADRLVGMGLLAVSGLVIQPAANPVGMYSITRAGLEVVRKVRSSHGRFNELAISLWGIAMAYARSPTSVDAKNLLSRDGNYAESHHVSGDVIDFGVWDVANWTRDAVTRLQAGIAGRLAGEEESTALPTVVDKIARDPSQAVDVYAQYLSTEVGRGAQ
jgi:hypothetical protein